MDFKDSGIFEVREYEGIKVLFKVDCEYDKNQFEEVYTIELCCEINEIVMSKKFYASPDATALEFWSEFNSVSGEGETIIDCHGLNLVQSLKRALVEFNS